MFTLPPETFISIGVQASLASESLDIQQKSLQVQFHIQDSALKRQAHEQITKVETALKTKYDAQEKEWEKKLNESTARIKELTQKLEAVTINSSDEVQRLTKKVFELSNEVEGLSVRNNLLHTDLYELQTKLGVAVGERDTLRVTAAEQEELLKRRVVENVMSHEVFRIREECDKYINEDSPEEKGGGGVRRKKSVYSQGGGASHPNFPHRKRVSIHPGSLVGFPLTPMDVPNSTVDNSPPPLGNSVRPSTPSLALFSVLPTTTSNLATSFQGQGENNNNYPSGVDAQRKSILLSRGTVQLPSQSAGLLSVGSGLLAPRKVTQFDIEANEVLGPLLQKQLEEQDKMVQICATMAHVTAELQKNNAIAHSVSIETRVREALRDAHEVYLEKFNELRSVYMTREARINERWKDAIAKVKQSFQQKKEIYQKLINDNKVLIHEKESMSTETGKWKQEVQKLAKHISDLHTSIFNGTSEANVCNFCREKLMRCEIDVQYSFLKDDIMALSNNTTPRKTPRPPSATPRPLDQTMLATSGTMRGDHRHAGVNHQVPTANLPCGIGSSQQGTWLRAQACGSRLQQVISRLR